MRHILLALVAILIASCSSGSSGPSSTIPINDPSYPTVPSTTVSVIVDAWADVTVGGDQFTVSILAYNPNAPETVSFAWDDALFIGGDNHTEFLRVLDTGWNEFRVPMQTTTGVVDRIWPTGMLYVNVSLGNDVVPVWPVVGGAG